MSLKKNLYLAIKEHLKTNVPKVKTFRLYNNQFESEELEDAFKYPAVFLEFENIEFRPTTANNENTDLTLNFRVGFPSLKTEDLEVFDLLNEIYLALQGFYGFIRIREIQETAGDNVSVWQQIYRTTLIDDVADITTNRKKVVIPEVQVDTDLIINPETVEGIRTENKIV